MTELLIHIHAGMSKARPAAPGWYWYLLPGHCTLQPVLVFDAGTQRGLLYTRDVILESDTDAERDGFSVASADSDTLWSTKPLVPPHQG